jgi:hypothetical protein
MMPKNAKPSATPADLSARHGAPWDGFRNGYFAPISPLSRFVAAVHEAHLRPDSHFNSARRYLLQNRNTPLLQN